MFSLASSLLSTVQGALRSDRAAAQSVDDQLEHVRQAMLDALGHGGVLFTSPLERRVMFAPNAETLWYLRPDLLVALATAEGERAAWQKIARITVLFQGLLPSSLLARPR